MTVLQVCAFAAPTGGNFISSLTYLENKLKERGIETIYAFADGAEGKPWCEEIQKRTKVYFLPTAKARILPRTYRIFKKIYKENRVSIIHSHFELYDIPATKMAPKGIKVFWHLHDPIKYNPSTRLSRRIIKKLQYGVFSRGATMLSVSLEHAKYAAELGFDQKHILYVPNGIDTTRVLSAYGERKTNRFLMFGWDVIRKGVDLVVEADSDDSLPPCIIHIVGQDSCREYLQNHPTEHIEFGEPVSDINELYQDSKAFLHVSRAEGLSYALLEAVYAGLPVICSDIPENQVAREFEGIFWVPDGSADEIRTQIASICGIHVPITGTAFHRNRTIIKEKYSLDAWIRCIMELYLTEEL